MICFSFCIFRSNMAWPCWALTMWVCMWLLSELMYLQVCWPEQADNVLQLFNRFNPSAHKILHQNTHSPDGQSSIKTICHLFKAKLSGCHVLHPWISRILNHIEKDYLYESDCRYAGTLLGRYVKQTHKTSCSVAQVQSPQRRAS